MWRNFNVIFVVCSDSYLERRSHEAGNFIHSLYFFRYIDVDELISFTYRRTQNSKIPQGRIQEFFKGEVEAGVSVRSRGRGSAPYSVNAWISHLATWATEG